MSTNRKSMPTGKCKFCGTVHLFLKTRCPAFRHVCRICTEDNHFENFCPLNKKTTEDGKSNNGFANNQMSKARCLFCGDNHPPDMSVCPAIGKFCCNCGKQNHSEKVCPQKKGNPQNSNPRCGYCKLPNHSERECKNKNMYGALKKSSSSKSLNYDGRTKHCNFCGEEHSVVKGSCPAYGKKCTYCKQVNHVAKICSHRIKAEMKRNLGDGNFLDNHSRGLKSSSTMSLNIPMGDRQAATLKTGTNKENGEGKQAPNKKVQPKRGQQRRQQAKKKESSDSSDSDNDDGNADEKKAKKLIEVASYYIMWQEYRKAKDYLIQAKLLSNLPEVDEKLAEIPRYEGQSSVPSS